MYQIVGIKPNGDTKDLFTWSGSIESGIDRARKEEKIFLQGYDRFTYRTLDPS